jgi:hypothetical protein
VIGQIRAADRSRKPVGGHAAAYDPWVQSLFPFNLLDLTDLMLGF